jgi:glycosyltransferase involved in cell wall biosynthesis
MQPPATALCVILAYNCESTLEQTYNRIPPESVDRIILVDDGSTDQTIRVAERLGIEHYTHPHVGYGGNVKYANRKGIELGYEYVVDLHGDGQYDPSAIPAAIAKAGEGYDLVLGSRFVPDRKQPLRDGMSYARYFANIGLSAVERSVLGSTVSEFHTGFRLYTRNLIETVALDNTSDDFLFGFEIIAQAVFWNLRIGEVPIRCDYREEHASMPIPKCIQYSFQTFKTLAQYRLAKMGVHNELFAAPAGRTFDVSSPGRVTYERDADAL